MCLIVLKTSMNLLYFDQSQLWSPDIAEQIGEDNEAAQAVSVSKIYVQEGR